MVDQFRITADEAAAVILATVGMYATFVVLVRLLGVRSLSAMSARDFGCVAAFGAVIGRTPLLAEPRLVSGLLALATLLAAQRTLSWLHGLPIADRFVGAKRAMLVRDGRVLSGELSRTRVSDDDLRQAIRLAGIGQLADVRTVVLERNGGLSVLSAVPTSDDWLWADVAGAGSLQPPDASPP